MYACYKITVIVFNYTLLMCRFVNDKPMNITKLKQDSERSNEDSFVDNLMLGHKVVHKRIFVVSIQPLQLRAMSLQDSEI